MDVEPPPDEVRVAGFAVRNLRVEVDLRVDLKILESPAFVDRFAAGRKVAVRHAGPAFPAL